MLTKETFDRATIKINYTVKPILMQDGTRQWWKTDAGASASRLYLYPCFTLNYM